MLENVMDAWEKRLQKCIEIDGKQVEVKRVIRNGVRY